MSAAQQSDSVIHLYTYILFLYSSIMVYHRLLSIVPCVIQKIDILNHEFYFVFF